MLQKAFLAWRAIFRGSLVAPLFTILATGGMGVRDAWWRVWWASASWRQRHPRAMA
jgi:hypothetical protein